MPSQPLANASPKITIAMLTFNRLNATAWCLESLLPTLDGRDEVTLVIRDQGSTDGTTRYLTDLRGFDVNVQLELGANLGVVGGRAAMHLAIAESEPDVVVYLDSDVVVLDPQWLDHLTAHFADERVGAAGPAGSYVRWGWDSAPGADFLPAFRGRCEVVSGWCLAVRWSLFAEASLAWDLDNYSPRWEEDSDLCLQVAHAGYEVRCTGDVGLQHVAGNSGDVAGLRTKTLRAFRDKWAGKGLIRAEGGY